MADTSSVYLVDDDRDVRVAIGALLRADGFSCRPFGAADDFLAEQPHLAPGCVLLDVRMPGKDGATMLGELRAAECDWPAIVMTGHAEVATAVRVMKLGAIEFLEKPFTDEALFEALGRGFTELRRRRDALARQTHVVSVLKTLSPREEEIMTKLAAGDATKQIAHTLSISPRTVEMHRANLMRKVGARNLRDLLAFVSEISATRTGHALDS